MTRRSWLVLVILATCAPSYAQPAATAADPAAVLHDALESFRAERGFPGGTLSAAFADGRVATAATGVADPRTAEPMTDTHRMLAGSQGKTFVAAVTLGLVEEGKLNLDARVSQWLGKEPWFARLPNAGALTLRHLMTHTSGIPDHLEVDEFWVAVRAAPDKSWRADELLSFVLDKPAQFAPGAGWAYSDTNYIIVGAAVEKAAGRAYYDLLRERILTPQGLHNIVPQESRRIDRLATGVTRLGERFGLTPGPVLTDGQLPFNPQMEWCGGGVAATTADLARWTQAWFSGSLVKPETLEAMLDGGPARTGPGQRYGLGVQLRDSPHGPVRFHGGWFPGYMGEMAYYTDHRVALSILVNTDAGVGPRSFQKLFDTVMEKFIRSTDGG